jgi:glycosyltransferase involved in cell wall biosynthesis
LGNVDILHSNTFCSPKKHPGKLVVTIHDLSFFVYPEFHTEANRTHCLKGTIEAALYADKIIAVSDHTKNDLVKYLNVPEEKIAVIYEAAGEQFKPVRDEALIRTVRKKYSLQKEYILTVGSIEPRKNHKRLIEAYSMLPAELRRQYDLVVAGGKGWLNSDIPALVEKLKLSTNVRFIGYVAEEDLPTLYSTATVFAYPSLYEGFGLPVLEAMACGCPTIVSANSSLSEIVDESGLFVDATSVDEISAKLQAMLTDQALRGKFRSEGIKKAAAFSWKETARQTLDVYKEVLC